MPTKKEYLTAAAMLWGSPESFAEAVYGVRTWDVANTFVHDLMSRPKARVAVKACHASSKTFTAAWLTTYWLTRFPNGKVVTTAPVYDQVEKILWAQIRELVRSSDIAQGLLGGEPLTTDIKLGPENFATGISTDEAVRFQGWHGKVLFIIDEAPGVRPDIFDALRGARAGGDVRVLMLGNPTIRGGPYYDAFNEDRHRWSTHTIDALSMPNQTRFLPDGVRPRDLSDAEYVDLLRDQPEGRLLDNPWPFLADPLWVIETWEDCAEDPENPIWVARCRGKFPDVGEGGLLDLSWFERWKDEKRDPGGPVDIGVDVAGPGENETSAHARAGDYSLDIAAWPDADPRGRLLRWMREWDGRIRRVNVDAIGEGHHLATHLADQGLPVEEIRVSERPWGETRRRRDDARERFQNLKAQLYWELRERARHDGIRGLDDDKTIAQLTTVQWDIDNRGRIFIVPKKKLRKKGIKSPDRAESVMLSYAEPPGGGVPSPDDIGIVTWQ